MQLLLLNNDNSAIFCGAFRFFLVKFPLHADSKLGSSYRIDVSTLEDRFKVKQFVESIHASFYSFDDQILAQETSQFPDIYPEFYDENLWKDVVQFKCMNNLSEEIVGTIGIYEKPDGVLYISTFYVSKECRHEGIGRLLWNQCFDFIREVNEVAIKDGMQSYKVHLITAKDVYDKAYIFYAKEGFKEIPLDFTPPAYCVLVGMELLLDASKVGV